MSVDDPLERFVQIYRLVFTARQSASNEFDSSKVTGSERAVLLQQLEAAYQKAERYIAGEGKFLSQMPIGYMLRKQHYGAKQSSSKKIATDSAIRLLKKAAVDFPYLTLISEEDVESLIESGKYSELLDELIEERGLGQQTIPLDSVLSDIETFRPIDIANEDPAGSVSEMLEFVGDWGRETAYNEDTIATLASKGLSSWDFVKTTLGIDLRNFIRRWRNVKPLLIADNAPESRDSVHNSYRDMLREAIMSYVYGQYASSIILCRSICEEGLRDILNEKSSARLGSLRPKDGEAKGMLFKVSQKHTSESERQVWEGVDEIRVAARDIAHKYGSVTTNNEDKALECIEKAQELVRKVVT